MEGVNNECRRYQPERKKKRKVSDREVKVGLGDGVRTSGVVVHI